jgi:hypothetical protein
VHLVGYIVRNLSLRTASWTSIIIIIIIIFILPKVLELLNYCYSFYHSNYEFRQRLFLNIECSDSVAYSKHCAACRLKAVGDVIVQI